MVVGNTELGIEMTIGKRSYPTMIQSNKVSELTKITVNEEGVCAGASVTWSSLEEFLLKLDQPSYKTRIYHNIVQMLRWFFFSKVSKILRFYKNENWHSIKIGVCKVLQKWKLTFYQNRSLQAGKSLFVFSKLKVSSFRNVLLMSSNLPKHQRIFFWRFLP